MKRLIVNADDYGYTPGISAGIRRAHRDGIVTSTTVMMTMPGADGALNVLKARAPTLAVGVHLVLTAGTPFTLPVFPERAGLVAALAELPAAALRAEWQAQIEAFLRAELPLTHLDSHHHAAYRHEKAFTVLMELAQHYGVPVRNPYPISGVDNRFAAPLFHQYGVRHPAHFLDAFDDDVPSAAMLREALERLPEGVTELMVHPGMVDDDLRRLSSLTTARAQELKALTDRQVREFIGQSRIELIHFGQL